MSGIEVPNELKELYLRFKEKVYRGETREFKNRNLGGRGFKFNDEEELAEMEMRKIISTGIGIEADEDDFDEEKRKNIQKEKEKKERKRIISDPKVISEIKKEAMAAASKAIKEGLSNDQIMYITQSAIKKFILNYNPSNKAKKIENEKKITEEFKYNQLHDKVSVEFEINGMPDLIKNKICSRDYLNQVEELTVTQITIRGIIVKDSNQSVYGQKKQHLYIEGDNKENVQSALFELKK